MSADKTLAGSPGGGRNLSIEFWRFLFTALVCVYHLDIFYAKREALVCGVCAVEFFFILAGFFLAGSAKRAVEENGCAYTPKMALEAALDYVRKKLKVIYPILIIVFLLGIFLPAWTDYGTPLQMLQNSEWDLLLLTGTPFGFMGSNIANIPLWFLTVLLITGYVFTYAMRRHYDFMKFAAPVIAVLTLAYFASNSEKLIDHDIFMGFLSAGMLRGVAGMALGISLHSLYVYLSGKSFSLLWRIVLSLLELYAIYRFFALTLYQPIGLDNFRRIVYIMIIILLSMLNVTALSRLLNNKISKWLGGLTLAMYMSHYVIITSYFLLVGAIKAGLLRHARSSPVINGVWRFTQEMGSYYGGAGASNTLTWKDAIAYLLFCVAAALVITLVIWLVKRLAARVKLLRS